MPRPPLAGFSRRLNQIETASLPPGEQVDHLDCGGQLEARMYELEVVRAWERESAALQPTSSAPAWRPGAVRLRPGGRARRRVVSKLRQVPRLVQAARDNIRECPASSSRSLETWRGTLRFIESDLPRACAALDRSANPRRFSRKHRASHGGITSYLGYLETTWLHAPSILQLGRAGSSRNSSSMKAFAQCRETAAIAERELTRSREFRRVAGRINGGDPLEAWRHNKGNASEPGT